MLENDKLLYARLTPAADRRNNNNCSSHVEYELRSLKFYGEKTREFPRDRSTVAPGRSSPKLPGKIEKRIEMKYRSDAVLCQKTRVRVSDRTAGAL